MALKINLDGIFNELMKKAAEKKKEKVLEETENNNDTIESPEDAPKTQEVAPATLKQSEEVHGGDEVAKEIKDSPNHSDDGQNKEKKKKINGYVKKENKEGYKNHNRNKIREQGGKKREKDTNKKENIASEDLVKEFIEDKIAQQEALKKQNRPEYLKKYILAIIKKIAAQHGGIEKQDGDESYDKKQMVHHMLKKQNHRLIGDKYDLKDARYVQFFIDTSGVYGCGSNRLLQEIMPEVIRILENQGYECHIAACGNGFYSRDMVDDEKYGTRKTLEEYNTGIVSDIACPTAETAAKMANEAEFSIILADFDGLTSICKMASLCQKDKIPFFLSTEDRYPWEEPTLHGWVLPELPHYYDPKLIYDVSIKRNPTLEEYYAREDEYYNSGNDYDDYGEN